MKRLACLMMALTIFFSLFLMGSPAVYAEDGETNQEIVDNTQNNTPEPTPESTPESTPEATPEPTQDPSIPSGGPFTFSKSGLSFIKTFILNGTMLNGPLVMVPDARMISWLTTRNTAFPGKKQKIF